MNKVLITGGAGFIGCNAAKRFLERGDEVIVFDNLSRKGTDKNLNWLKKQNGHLIFVKGDIRSRNSVNALFKNFGKIDLVLHMAAQVAVTTSVVSPREDFEINALGTLNLLEAIRASKVRPVIINASTNKVYGGMESIKVKEGQKRYQYKQLPYGISERELISFCSPYGCSKGAAEQYILDYSKIYGIKTVNFRQSCIYGPRQFGVEDQGWVAHFIIASVLKKKITIYGDGKQVRDILYIDDLIDAFIKVYRNINKTNGKSYNIGGGKYNSVSLLEFIDLLEDSSNKKVKSKFRGWRPADQRIYISDIRLAKKDFDWTPKVDIKKGINLLFKWIKENKGLFNDF